MAASLHQNRFFNSRIVPLQPISGGRNSLLRLFLYTMIAIICSVSFLSCIVLASVTGQVPAGAMILYLFASPVTFLAYALDKSAASNGRSRMPESALHLLAFAGGWPGALLAQSMLRHKLRKRRFLWVFWLTVAGNCSVLPAMIGN